jgi:hypothetical protein
MNWDEYCGDRVALPINHKGNTEYIRADLADPAHYKYMVELSATVTRQAKRIAQLEDEIDALRGAIWKEGRNPDELVKQIESVPPQGRER